MQTSLPRRALLRAALAAPVPADGFVCLIRGEAELPVRAVTLRNMAVRTVRGTAVVSEHVRGVDNRGDVRA